MNGCSSRANLRFCSSSSSSSCILCWCIADLLLLHTHSNKLCRGFSHPLPIIVAAIIIIIILKEGKLNKRLAYLLLLLLLLLLL
jgi:glucose uptake protein GlcU